MSRKEILQPIANNAAVHAGIAAAYVGLARDFANYELAGFSPFGAKTAKPPAEKPLLTTEEALMKLTRVAVTLSKQGTSSRITVVNRPDGVVDVILTTSD